MPKRFGVSTRAGIKDLMEHPAKAKAKAMEPAERGRLLSLMHRDSALRASIPLATGMVGLDGSTAHVMAHAPCRVPCGGRWPTA